MYLIQVTAGHGSMLQLLSARPMENGKPALINHFMTHYANLAVSTSLTVQGVNGTDQAMQDELIDAIGPILIGQSLAVHNNLEAILTSRTPWKKALDLLSSDRRFNVKKNYVTITNGGNLMVAVDKDRYALDISNGTVNTAKLLWLLAPGEKTQSAYTELARKTSFAKATAERASSPTLEPVKVVGITPDAWPLIINEYFKGVHQNSFGPFANFDAVHDWKMRRKAWSDRQPHGGAYAWTITRLTQPEAASL